MTNFLFAFALPLLFVFSSHADPKYRILEHQEFARAKFMAARGEADTLGGLPVVVKDGIFSQKLDHFSAPDARVFNQRYFYSSTRAKAKNSPVLIFICGEGVCSSGALQGIIQAHAYTIGAHLFALEHRYYGKTQPFADLSTENLKYLSTEQALEDLVQFKRAMQKQMGLTGPWIAVGGSYAGNLAAYLRSQYPLDFAAALASSAPVLPDHDFSEYDRHVARMAGPTCTKAINTVVADIEEQIKTDEGFQAARSLFMADTVSRRDDFLYLLADIASAAIQYGMRDDFCNAIEAQGQAGYVAMKKKVDQLFGNFADYSAEAAENIAVANHSGALGMRQWFYQSCTEYGYWQNAHAKESMRSKQINASYHDELCRRLFGLQKAGSVDLIMKKLYEPLLNPAITSRILYTSGSVDPWINLSIINENGNNVNPNTEAFLMQGAAHCDDLGRGNAPDVKVAIQRFRDLLPTWIK